VHAVKKTKALSFAVARGETFGSSRPNGAGKTTTLEMIEGLTPPDAGSIEILGQDVWPNPTRVQSHIGVQLQKNALFENLTAAELLDLSRASTACRSRPRAPAARARRLDRRGDSQARQLSGGSNSDLAIALCARARPEIVFLDEPTTGLDPQARRNLWDVHPRRRSGEPHCRPDDALLARPRPSAIASRSWTAPHHRLDSAAGADRRTARPARSRRLRRATGWRGRAAPGGRPECDDADGATS